MLSANKKLFLSQDLDSLPKARPISAAQIDKLIAYYQMKNKEEKTHDVCILKNGRTEFGQARIEKNKFLIRQRHHELRLDLEDKNKKYYYCIKRLGFFYDFEKKFSLHFVHVGRQMYDLLLTFLSVQGYSLPQEPSILRPDLNENDIEAIQQFVSNQQELKQVIDDLIQRFLAYSEKKLAQELEDCSPLYPEAWEEIFYIQSSLKPEDAVAYVYTGGHALQIAHIEILILKHDRVIKPLSWYQMFPIANSKINHSFDLNLGSKKTKVCEVDFNSPIILQTEQATPCAQGDKTSCASLVFKYLKELLKNKQEQLREYCLEFPYYDDSESIHWFFFPSPQVLRYSQSRLYNQLLRSMLIDTISPVAISDTKTDTSYQIATIKKLLTDSLEIAQKKADDFVIEHNSHVLETLNAFREKWLSAYKISQKQRYGFDIKGANRYLMYAHQRLLEHTETTSGKSKKRKTNPEEVLPALHREGSYNKP